MPCVANQPIIPRLVSSAIRPFNVVGDPVANIALFFRYGCGGLDFFEKSFLWVVIARYGNTSGLGDKISTEKEIRAIIHDSRIFVHAEVQALQQHYPSTSFTASTTTETVPPSYRSTHQTVDQEDD